MLPRRLRWKGELRYGIANLDLVKTKEVLLLARVGQVTLGW